MLLRVHHGVHVRALPQEFICRLAASQTSGGCAQCMLPFNTVNIQCQHLRSSSSSHRLAAPFAASFLKAWGVAKKMRLWGVVQASALSALATVPVISWMDFCAKRSSLLGALPRPSLPCRPHHRVASMALHTSGWWPA